VLALTSIISAPVALVTNIVAVVLDKFKAYAIAGLVISALTCLLYFLIILMTILMHS
jgi:hypothetical protein